MKTRTVLIPLLGLALLALALAACVPLPPVDAPAAPSAQESLVPRPSTPGGPGPALALTGNVTSGAQVFETRQQ